jgi:uncharacterized coiled-coil protein SlyX
MQSRIIIGGLVALFVLSLGTSSYLYARATQLENRIAQLEQTTKEQKAAIDRLEQTAREQKAAIDTLETTGIGKLNTRVDRIENAAQPFLDGTPVLVCTSDSIKMGTCSRVAFVKSPESLSVDPPGRLFYHDDANKLDRSAIERAAQQLVNRGALIAIYTTSSNGGPEEFVQRLQQDGLYSAGIVHPGVIAIYISLSPPYSEIRVGDSRNNMLKSDTYMAVIDGLHLRSRLSAEDYTGAVTNVLGAIDLFITSYP